MSIPAKVLLYLHFEKQNDFINMRMRILLALPMFLLLCYMGYELIVRGGQFETLELAGIVIAALFAFHFIWMQLSHKFIDFRDGFKIKDISAVSSQYFQKQRRIVEYIILGILIVIVAFNFFAK